MTKLFQPTLKQIQSSNLYAFENYLAQRYKKKFKNYSQLWNWSIKNCGNFWRSIAEFYEVPLLLKRNSKLFKKNTKFWKNIFFYNYDTNYFYLIEKNKSNDLPFILLAKTTLKKKLPIKSLILEYKH